MTDRSNDAQAILALGEDWDAALAAKDLDRVMGFFADDAQSLADNAAPARGREEVRALWEALLALPGLVFTTKDEIVQVSDGGDMAYTIGAHRIGFDTPEGRIEDEGKYLLVWRKRAGVWKLVADMSNSNLPSPA